MCLSPRPSRARRGDGDSDSPQQPRRPHTNSAQQQKFKAAAESFTRSSQTPNPGRGARARLRPEAAPGSAGASPRGLRGGSLPLRGENPGGPQGARGAASTASLPFLSFRQFPPPRPSSGDAASPRCAAPRRLWGPCPAGLPRARRGSSSPQCPPGRAGAPGNCRRGGAGRSGRAPSACGPAPGTWQRWRRPRPRWGCGGRTKRKTTTMSAKAAASRRR